MLAFLILSAIFAALGMLLGYSSLLFKQDADPIVEKINALLPQTQCGQCGFPGCKPYAESIAQGTSDINLCPPGGESSIKALADLLGKEVKPLNAASPIPKEKSIAVIDEQACIGCTLCIQACPVDAILGAAKYMHTVIASECTGCELCLPPCPVDCIALKPIATNLASWQWPMPSARVL
jgi:electron transport complex protein RnfB